MYNRITDATSFPKSSNTGCVGKGNKTRNSHRKQMAHQLQDGRAAVIHCIKRFKRLATGKITQNDVDRPYITSYERFIVIKSLSTYILCLHKHYINYNQTLVTLTFRSLSETFVRRSCSVLFLVLATVVWRCLSYRGSAGGYLLIECRGVAALQVRSSQ